MLVGEGVKPIVHSASHLASGGATSTSTTSNSSGAPGGGVNFTSPAVVK